MLSVTTSTVPALAQPISETHIPAAQQFADALATVGQARTIDLSGGTYQADLQSLAPSPLLAASPMGDFVGPIPAANFLSYAYVGPQPSADAAPPSALVFQGTDNVNDELDLNLANLPRNADGSLQIKTIVYNGGAAGYDTLKLTGGTFQRTTYTATGKDSGILTHDDLTIIFTGLEPVIDTSDSYAFDIYATNDADDIYVVDAHDDTYGDMLRVYEANSNFEEVWLANDALVCVHGQDGNDTFHVNYTNSIAGIGYLELDGEGGDDSFYAGAGDVTLSGGEGTNTFAFVGSGQLGYKAIYEDGGTATFDLSGVDFGVGFTTDLYTHISSGDPEDTNYLWIDLGFVDYSTTVMNIIGTQYDDTITDGNGMGGWVEGLGGDDTIDAWGGTVVYTPADSGSDTIVAADTLDFSAMTDDVTIDLSNQSTQQTVVPDVLNVQLESYANYTTVIGGSGNDTIIGNSNNNTLSGGAGDDTISGGSGNDTLYGNDGDDTLIGSTGNDALQGGAGSDTYVFDPSAGNLGSDTITEAATADSDTLDFSAFTTTVTVDLSSTSSQTIHSGTLALTLSSNTAIENVLGGSANDTITGNSRDNYLFGGDGDDTLSGGDGNDWLEGGAGTDSLTGGSGDDTYIFNPLAAADGDLGSDTVYESTSGGNDTLDFSNYSDALSVTLASTSAQNVDQDNPGTLYVTLDSSHHEVENIIGGSGDDALTGNSLANILDGRDGNDTLIGNDGDDRLYGGAGEDVLEGNAGSDALYGQDDNDTLYGGTGDDFLYGGDGNDTLTDYDHSGSTTEGGADRLDGGDGNDQLYGYSGADILIGGAGDDALHGGDGNDTYTFNWNPGDYGLGADTIFESSGSGTGDDTLDFSHFFATDYNNSLNLGITDAQTVSDDSVSDPIVDGEDQTFNDLLTVNFDTASTVESVTDPGTFTSAVAGVDVSPQDQSGGIQLYAYGVQGTSDSVSFYCDSNANGILDAGDQLLGMATDGTYGYSIDIPYDPTQNALIADDGNSTPVHVGAGPAAVIAAVGSGGTTAAVSPPTNPGLRRPPVPRPDGDIEIDRDFQDPGVHVRIDAAATGGDDPNPSYHTANNEDQHHDHATKPDSKTLINTAGNGGTATSTASANIFSNDQVPSDEIRVSGRAKAAGKAVSAAPTGSTHIPGPAMTASPDAVADTHQGNNLDFNNVWVIRPTSDVVNSVYTPATNFDFKIKGEIGLDWKNFATTSNAGGHADSTTIIDIKITFSIKGGSTVSETIFLYASTSASAAENTLKMTSTGHADASPMINPKGGTIYLPIDVDMVNVSANNPATVKIDAVVHQTAPVDATDAPGGDQSTTSSSDGQGFFSIKMKATNVQVHP